MRLALDWEAFLRFVFDPELPRSCVFESGLRFGADFKVVSFFPASSGVVSTASAAAWGVVVTFVSGSVWAVVSVSTGT